MPAPGFVEWQVCLALNQADALRRDCDDDTVRRGGSRLRRFCEAAETASGTLEPLISRRAGPKVLTDGESEGELPKPARL